MVFHWLLAVAFLTLAETKSYRQQCNYEKGPNIVGPFWIITTLLLMVLN